MSKRQQHYHKYKLVNLTRDPKKKAYYVYACQLPNCTHFLRIELINGKRALCNKCGNLFDLSYARITKNHLTVRPICEACVRTRNKPIQDDETITVDSIETLMQDILPKGL